MPIIVSGILLEEWKMKYKGMEGLDSLPSATVQKLYGEEGEIEGRKAIFEEDKFVQVVSNHYRLIQHKDAFGKALKQMEVPKDAKIEFNTQIGKANMQVFFDDLSIKDDSKLGIELGFSVRNSYDKSSSLGLQVKKTAWDKSGRYIVLCAKRLVCDNGMTIMVPLAEMTAVEQSKLTEKDVHAVEKGVVKNETVEAFAGSVKHMGELALKYANLLGMANQAVPYVEKKIKEAIKVRMSEKQFRQWLEDHKYSGVAIKAILARYELEAKNAWGAYNAITYIASHDVKSQRQKERMTERAWEMVAVPTGVSK